MVPVIGGKVEERQQCFAILDQAFDGLVANVAIAVSAVARSDASKPDEPETLLF
jgi:hypothetical protein